MTEPQAEPSVVAIVPARGGSKGIVHKNLQFVGGASILQRSITNLQATATISRVYLSSDNDDYLQLASRHHAFPIKRSDLLASDTASSESALLAAISKIHESDVYPEVVVFAQATSPFIDSAAISRAVSKVQSGEFDVVFSAFETYGFLWGEGADGSAKGINHDPGHRPRRQDREPHYMETGAFYVMRTEGFLKAKHRFFGRVGIEVVSEHSAIEIDTPEDLEIARVLARHFDSQVEALDVDTIIMDFDGVHTENSAFVSQDGTETVKVSRSDGFGIEQLKAAGKKMLIISKETNPVVTARAGKLGVEVLQGIESKKQALLDWADENQVDLERSCYVGNDVNDIECMEIVGTSVAVADAEPEVLNLAKVVLKSSGGQGALRELSRMILSAGE